MYNFSLRNIYDDFYLINILNDRIYTISSELYYELKKIIKNPYCENWVDVYNYKNNVQLINFLKKVGVI